MRQADFYTSKTSQTVEFATYQINHKENKLYLYNPQGNILGSMRFLKKNQFEITTNGLTFSGCNFVSYGPYSFKSEKMMLVFEFTEVNLGTI